jgi:hypothetical protein
VFIYPGKFLGQIARALLTSLVLSFLLIPVVICKYLDNTLGRLAVIAVSTMFFVVMLSGLVRANTVDIAIAGSA